MPGLIFSQGDCVALRTIEEDDLDFVQVLETNPGFQAVLAKLGFTQEGIARKQCFIDGERVDMYSYGLLDEEWLSRNE